MTRPRGSASRDVSRSTAARSALKIVEALQLVEARVEPPAGPGPELHAMQTLPDEPALSQDVGTKHRVEAQQNERAQSAS